MIQLNLTKSVYIDPSKTKANRIIYNNNINNTNYSDIINDVNKLILADLYSDNVLFKNNYIIIYKYSMQAFKNLLIFSLLSMTGTGLYWHFYPKYFNENRRN